MREYLSNHYGAGPLPSFLAHFKQADLAGRKEIVRREEQFRAPRLRPLAILQLHECDELAPLNPRGTLPGAEFALALAEKTGDADLISWAYSGLGNLSRLLANYGEAGGRLKKARKLAVSPYQKADATRLLGALMLTLANEDPKRVQKSLVLFTEALQICLDAPKRFNSDRGYTMALHDKAIAHLTLGLSQAKHNEVGKSHLYEVLAIASPLHARRSRKSALLNLVRCSLKFDEKPIPEFVEELRKSPFMKSSLEGAMIQWALIYDELRKEGYSRKLRRRLLTVRGHLAQHQALDYASKLTMAIAALDAVHGKPGALPFLQKRESQAILAKADPAIAASLYEAYYMSPETILGLAEQAGVGDVYSITTNQPMSPE
jgi:hypothetical protein